MITTKKMNSFKQKHFTGESTDNKPTTCGVNSLFVEIDTGDTYFFDGYQWIKAELPEHGGITPSGNIEITENTAEGSPLNIVQYATATVNVPSSGIDFVIPEQTKNFPDTGRVFLETDFPAVLTDNIIVQLIGTAYGQPIHALLIAGKAIDEGGNAMYVGEATNTIGGQSMTMRLTISKVAAEENWGAFINVNNVQTAFTNVLISGIAEWETTPQ